MPLRPARSPAGPRARLSVPQVPPRALMLAGAALTVLLVVVLVGRAVLAPHHRPPAPTLETTAVFMSVTSIPAHMPITPEVARAVPMRRADVPKDAVTSPVEFQGMVTKETIPPQTVITHGRLIPIAEAQGLVDRLSDGTEAVTILIPKVEAGVIAPGNIVDVLATFANAQAPAANGSRQSPLTTWAATHARVLAATDVEVPTPKGPGGGPGPSQAGGSGQIPMVGLTLQVDPADAPMLMLGYHTGRLAIAVVPRDGSDTTSGTGISLATLASKLIPAPKEPAPESHAHTAAPAPVYIPPIPQVPQPATPQQASTPAVKLGPPLHRVEVILGSDVRLELVPGSGERPSERSSQSRSRATSSGQAGPGFVPMPLPPQGVPPTPGQVMPPPQPSTPGAPTSPPDGGTTYPQGGQP